MRRLVIEGAATGLVAGSMLVGMQIRAGLGNAWIALAALIVAVIGAVGIAVGCRKGATTAVRTRRIVALALLGFLVPASGLIAQWAAPLGSWGMWTATVLAFLAGFLTLSRLTPMNINSWVAAERTMPPNTSLERTREG